MATRPPSKRKTRADAADEDRGLAKPAAPATAIVLSNATPPAVVEEDGPIEPEAILEEVDDEEEEDEDDDGEPAGPVLDVQPTSSAATPALVPTSPSAPARVGSYGRSATLDQFLAQVGRYPVLTLEEEQELTNAVYEHNDPVAARKLVVHNLRLVVKMAYKYRRAWANVLDLIQEGNIGLMEAVKRFDPFKGARFSTYAAYWIRAYMIRYLLEHSRLVRISRTRAGRKLFFRLSKERERLRAMGMEPGPKLLAERLGVSEEDFHEVVKHMDQPEIRLDAPLFYDGDGGDTILDTMRSETTNPERQAVKNELAADVGAALERFSQTITDARERAAWDEHMMADEPTPLSVLGERFGVTKQRMGQIVMGLRKRLKTHLVAELGPDVELQYAQDDGE